jgi:hypothetical protein
MKNVKETYTDFHKKNSSVHLYPTEWVIRTMLGNYPRLSLDRSKYKGGKILDLGFGDCRNMSLLANCGLEIFGVEITQDIVDLGYNTLKQEGINATLKVGRNTDVPYPDNYFDYILACASCYYIDEGYTFRDNLVEITRTLRSGGYFIANFCAFTDIEAIPPSFILDKAINTDDGHIIVQNDVFGMRNGYKFKAFSSENEIRNELGELYDDISIGYCFDNFYGLQINAFIVVAKKK